ncbi:type II secretion system protein GspG [Patescibacteria group bacterium]|nr:type II secretion system protein GspG [Patescibacteria group bacterium]
MAFRKVVFITFSILIFLCIGTFALWAILRSSTQYAVYQTLYSIKNKDSLIFNKFCNFGSVVDHAYKDLVTEIISGNSNNSKEYNAVEIEKFLELLKPRFEKSIVEPIITRKEESSLWETDKIIETSAMNMFNLVRKMKVEKKEDTAELSLNGQLFYLNKDQSGWRITSAKLVEPTASVREEVSLNFQELESKLSITSITQRDETAKQDISKLAKIIEAYYTDNYGRYPHSLTELKPYINVLPYTPQGKEYGYRAYSLNKGCKPELDCHEASIFYSLTQKDKVGVDYCYQTVTGVLYLEVPSGNCDADFENDLLD